MSDYDLVDEMLVPLVAGLLAEHRARAAAVWGGPLPRLRSSAFAVAPREVQVAVLVLLGSTWLSGTPGLHVLKQASRDVHGAADWQRIACDWVPLEEREGRGWRIPRIPARCARCHNRQCTGHEGAA